MYSSPVTESLSVLEQKTKELIKQLHYCRFPSRTVRLFALQAGKHLEAWNHKDKEQLLVAVNKAQAVWELTRVWTDELPESAFTDEQWDSLMDVELQIQAAYETLRFYYKIQRD